MHTKFWWGNRLENGDIRTFQLRTGSWLESAVVIGGGAGGGGVCDVEPLRTFANFREKNIKKRCKRSRISTSSLRGLRGERLKRIVWRRGWGGGSKCEENYSGRCARSRVRVGEWKLGSGRPFSWTHSGGHTQRKELQHRDWRLGVMHTIHSVPLLHQLSSTVSTCSMELPNWNISASDPVAYFCNDVNKVLSSTTDHFSISCFRKGLTVEIGDWFKC
jgi:hypothetical protein